MYAFVNGPLVWIAFAVLVFGSLWQIVSLYKMSRRTDKVFYDHYNPGAAAGSIWAWLMPFGSRSWREHPGLTLGTFAFHICLILVPLFALGHAVTLEFNRGIGWPSLPDGVADKMTLVFLAAALFLLIRRFVVPQVRIVTEPKDIVVWCITVLPFLTGYLSAHKMLLDPDTMLLLHVFSGCLMLICIPFTKLAHVFLFFMTRAFIGSEFARRGTKTW
jgi:nitrate reductase gamma subunit